MPERWGMRRASATIIKPIIQRAHHNNTYYNMAAFHFRQIFILTFFNNFIANTWSFLNIEEIQNTKYGLEIAGVPILLKEVS